jgi:hypothetical protein
LGVIVCGRVIRACLQWHDGSKQMPLDDILRKFATDLAGKGKVKSAQAAMDMNRCAQLPAAISFVKQFFFQIFSLHKKFPL